MLPGKGREGKGRKEGRKKEREQSWPWPKPLTLEGLLFGSQYRGGWMGTDGVIDGGGSALVIHFFSFRPFCVA